MAQILVYFFRFYLKRGKRLEEGQREEGNGNDNNDSNDNDKELDDQK